MTLVDQTGFGERLRRGFAIEVPGNLVDSNIAASNGHAEFVIAPGNVDRVDSNRANGSTFRFGEGGGTFE